MRKSKEARDDIYDTVVSFKHIRYFWYALGVAGLVLLCYWGYESDRNRGMSMIFVSVVFVGGWFGLQKLRRDGWFPSWPPPPEKPKPTPPRIPQDGRKLSQHEMNELKKIEKYLNSDES